MALMLRMFLVLALLAAAPAALVAAQEPAPAAPPAAPAIPATGPEAVCRAEGGEPLATAEICRRLGFANEMGALPGASPARALWFHDRACRLGAVQGCVAAARLSASGVTGDPAQGGDAGVPTYQRLACELEAKECLAYGLAFETGQGLPRSLKSALGVYLRGCEAGVGRACARAAGVNRTMRGKPLVVTGLFLRACTLDDAGGCLEAGRRISSGLGAMVDQDGAQTLFAKACRLDKALCGAGSLSGVW